MPADSVSLLLVTCNIAEAVTSLDRLDDYLIKMLTTTRTTAASKARIDSRRPGPRLQAPAQGAGCGRVALISAGDPVVWTKKILAWSCKARLALAWAKTLITSASDPVFGGVQAGGGPKRSRTATLLPG